MISTYHIGLDIVCFVSCLSVSYTLILSSFFHFFFFFAVALAKSLRILSENDGIFFSNSVIALLLSLVPARYTCPVSVSFQALPSPVGLFTKENEESM
jgi:hypothetical protein